MLIHRKMQNKEHVVEALQRAKLKVHGCWQIHISKKWDFTKFNADEFEDMVTEMWFIPDGYGVKYIPKHDPLEKLEPDEDLVFLTCVHIQAHLYLELMKTLCFCDNCEAKMAPDKFQNMV